MSRGGRKPKPTHLKLIQGNPGKRRISTKEVQPRRELPSAPDFLNAIAKAEWARIGDELYRLGLLTMVDVQPLAAYCQAYGRWVEAESALALLAAQDQITHGLMIRTTNGNAIQNPLVGTANKAASDMVRYAAEFGLTPSARARLAAGPVEKQEGAFSGLLA